MSRSIRTAYCAGILLLTLGNRANGFRADQIRTDTRAAPAASATTDSPSEVVNPMLPVRLRVVDADGQPVEAAIIRPSGLRAKLEPAGHYSWFEAWHGTLPTAVTDAEGFAELVYPKYVAEELETGAVTWSVDHENFVTFREDLSVDLKLPEIKLARGRRIAFSATHGQTAEPILTRLYAELSGSGSANEWKAVGNGTLMSRAVKRERNILRAIHLPEAAPVLFSDPVFIGGNNQEFLTSVGSIPLNPGVRLTGRIDDQVPRPIRSGHVTIRAVNSISTDQRASALLWGDWARIEADGSFTIEAVPRDSIVMMFAVCEGWISSAATADDLAAAKIPSDDPHWSRSSFVMPQVARATENSTSWLVPMLSTATCLVTVQRPDGSPLPGATVEFWPNQYWPGAGSQIVGDGFRSSVSLTLTEAQRNQLWTPGERTSMRERGVLIDCRHFYTVPTDALGVAVITTLPAGTSETPTQSSFMVEHPEF